MDNCVPRSRMYDTNITLLDDTKENRERALLGKPVTITTMHADNPFIEETSFIVFTKFLYPWDRGDTHTVMCKNERGKIIQIHIDDVEMKRVAGVSFVNTTQLAAVFGYTLTATPTPSKDDK